MLELSDVAGPVVTDALIGLLVWAV